MNPQKPLETAKKAKKALRAQAIARRSNVVVDSASVCRSLEPFLIDNLSAIGGVVVVYDALDDEINLGPLWEPTLDQSNPAISYAITRTPEKDMKLTIHSVRSELERHRWGYRQPVAGSSEIDVSEVFAVLVPALAFDLAGGRIGWGAGYYDRLLASVNPEALRIGIGDGNFVSHVPTEPHDVAMTHIATPTGVITV